MKRLLLAAALLSFFVPATLEASLNRIAGPTHITTDGRVVDMFDVAFDTVNQVYLVVWGTFGYGPTNGQFLNRDGTPIGGVFPISEGTPQAGWARVTYGGGKFLVAYTKILGTVDHRRSVRFVTYQPGSPAQLSAEIEIDTWKGGAGSASGVGYSNGRYLVAWWNFNDAPPQTYLTILDANGGYLAYKVHVSTYGDGQTDPEIACDSSRGRCLVVGQQYGIFNPAVCGTAWGCPGTWGQFVSDSTGARIGSGFTAAYGPIQKETSVAYNAATDRYIVAFSRGQNTVWGARLDGGTGSKIDEVLLRDANMTPEGVGFGLPIVSYNPATESTIVAMMPWSGQTAALELDRNGVTVPGSFQFIPGVPITDFNAGTKEVAAATDPVNSRFLVADIQAFLHLRATTFSAVPAPPPCNATLTPTSIAAPGVGRTASVTVTGDCTWTATPSAGWIAITGGGSGTGGGTVQISIGQNPSPSPRSGTITIAGRTVSVSQEGFIPRAAVHDLSGDGLSDIMWHHQGNGRVAVWTLNGWTVTSTYFLNGGAGVNLNWKLNGTGDLDGNGYADLVWRHTDGSLAVWLMGPGGVATMTFMMNASDPNIPPIPAFQPEPAWQIRGVGDLDGDGRADLVWQNEADGRLAVWIMHGHYVVDFRSLSIGSTSLAWRVAGVGDINRDGRADIIWQNRQNGLLAAWLMNAQNVLSTQFLSHHSPSLDWHVRGVGDVNGDGYADLLWQHTTGLVGVWYLNNLTVTGMYSLSVPFVTDTGWLMVGPG